jgi:hypothetical protein
MTRPFGEGVPPPRAFPGSAAPSNSRFNNQLWISLLALPALANMRVLNDDALLRDALIGNFADHCRTKSPCVGSPSAHRGGYGADHRCLRELWRRADTDGRLSITRCRAHHLRVKQRVLRDRGGARW